MSTVLHLVIDLHTQETAPRISGFVVIRAPSLKLVDVFLLADVDVRVYNNYYVNILHTLIKLPARVGTDRITSCKCFISRYRRPMHKMSTRQLDSNLDVRMAAFFKLIYSPTTQHGLYRVTTSRLQPKSLGSEMHPSY